MSEVITEEDFELQRKFIKDNAYDFDYHDTDKFSEAFRNKYPKIFNNSLGYKEVLEYSKDFGDFNLTLISYDYGLRSLSLSLGYGNLVRLLKKYEEFFDTIDEKVPVPFFLRELTLSAGSSMRKRKENADDIDTIFRKCIMYTLPRLNICSTEEEYAELFSKFGFSFLDVNDLDDLYLSIGSLRYTAGYIIDLLFEDKKDVMDIYLSKVNNRGSISNKASKGDIIVAGTDDILVTIATCCKPVKGDPIIGYITKGEGIAVHKKDCPNIKNSTRLIDVEWNMNSDSSYLTDITIKVVRGKNQLLDIITKASQKDVYIESVKTIEELDSTTFALTIKTTSSTQLDNFIGDLKSLPFLIEVERKSKI